VDCLTAPLDEDVSSGCYYMKITQLRRSVKNMFENHSVCGGIHTFPHWTSHTYAKHYAATSPPLNFYIFKFNDFNKEPTFSLKMIWLMIETCWSVFKCFNINILD
jgi:hypothetical protein